MPYAGPLDDLLGPSHQEEQGYLTFSDDKTRTNANMFMINMVVEVVPGFQQTPATDHSGASVTAEPPLGPLDDLLAGPRDDNMTPGKTCSACGDRVNLPNSDYPTCECGRFQCQ